MLDVQMNNGLGLFMNALQKLPSLMFRLLLFPI